MCSVPVQASRDNMLFIGSVSRVDLERFVLRDARVGSMVHTAQTVAGTVDSDRDGAAGGWALGAKWGSCWPLR